MEQVYDDEILQDPAAAMDYILHHGLHGMMETEDAVEDGRILLPAWSAVLTPEIAQINERGIILNLHLSAPQWGRPLFECSVGMGGSSMQNNIGLATGSFLFSFMQGIAEMERGAQYEALSTTFAGKEHRWKVYRSNIVGLGQGPEIGGPDLYWNELKAEIAKRLGNQKLCYVKIYGAKMGGDITGECRIDDVKSDELSEKVAKLVAKWDVDGFASHKQFFFIRQEEDTTLPNPYLGADGEALLREKVITAAKLFHTVKTQEEYDALPQRLAAALGDATLAGECFAFLPEICTQNAFSEVGYAETIDISWPDGRRERVYKNQLSDFYPLWSALFNAFGSGIFGTETNDIYRELIGASASYGAIRQMQEKGSRLSDARLTALLYQVGEDFELR